MKSKPERTLTIRKEMFLLGFLCLIFVSFLFAGIFLRLLYLNNMTNAKNSLRECNSKIVAYTEGVFHENATIVEILSCDDTVIHAGYGSAAKLTSIFDSIKQRNSNITYIYAGYSDGGIFINDYLAPQGYNSTTRPWYLAAQETDGVARLVYSDAATGEWLFSQCKKIVNKQGDAVGAIAIDCSNESIFRQLSTKYQYTSQRSFIVDLKGVVLIHPENTQINQSLRENMDAETWNTIISENSNYAEYKYNNVHTMAYFERITATDFMVVTAIDASEVMNPIMSSISLWFVFIVCISLLLGYGLSRILIHRFARPIVELGGRIQNLAAGCPDRVHSIHFSNTEINEIADSIEVIVKDIANREEQKKAAEYLSFHDSMTGLYNRRFFEEELKRLDVKRNYPICIICCDINGLKLVNDVFGHAVGDKLICSVARCLEKGCRADDILARMGGDEFAVVLPHTSSDDVQKVILRIKAGFPEDNIYGAEVSASLGFAVKEEKEQSLNEVLHAADEMMYDQKIKESIEMKHRTVSNIIAAAESEMLIRSLTIQEESLLNALSDELCPDLNRLLKESYRLRKIGLCTLVYSLGYNSEVQNRRHTETGYRILSALDDYRSIAGCVLHYTEHWDGSGWPAGLTGNDIPLLSRMMATVEVYSNDGMDLLRDKSGVWYDPKLVAMLNGMENLKK